MPIKRLIAATLLIFTSSLALSDNGTFKFNFDSAEIGDIIKVYARSTGETFVVEPAVRGKASIFVQGELSRDQAFEQLSSVLALNGFAIVERNGTYIVRQARQVARDAIPTVTEVPTLTPERIVSWVYTFKNRSANDFNREMRNVTSKDGELYVAAENKLVFTDWTSTLHRVSQLLAEYDKADSKPIARATEKRVEKKTEASIVKKGSNQETSD